MSEFVTVAKVGDIPDGEGRAFEVNDQMVAVFNNGGEYLAIDDMCPHMGASLAAGFFDKADCTVTCPWHGWRFETRDGSWCDNRRLKIDVFQIRLVGNEIQVAETNTPAEDPDSDPTAPTDTADQPDAQSNGSSNASSNASSQSSPNGPTPTTIESKQPAKDSDGNS